MELNDAINGRRSIRIFKEGSITESQIDEMVAAANKAPSWKNSQTPRFYVANSEEGMNKIREGLPERNAEHTVNAVALFVLAFGKDRAGFARNGSPDNEAGNGWGFFDNGLACQNLLLKAYELGYGTLVMGIRNEAVLRRNLEIPASQTITAVISVGVPNIDPSMPKRKNVDDILTKVE